MNKAEELLAPVIEALSVDSEVKDNEISKYMLPICKVNDQVKEIVLKRDKQKGGNLIINSPLISKGKHNGQLSSMLC